MTDSTDFNEGVTCIDSDDERNIKILAGGDSSESEDDEVLEEMSLILCVHVYVLVSLELFILQ